MVLIRFPIAYAVGISTILCMLSMGQNLVSLPQQMVKGVWSFSLMAVPFFITMGVLMGTGGISDKLIALANSLVGWMRGGLAMVNIVASYFFGGISGSAAADTASLGSILIPMVVDEGYDADFSTASGSAQPQHGHLCNIGRRCVGRRSLYGRLYSRCYSGNFSDGGFLYSFC